MSDIDVEYTSLRDTDLEVSRPCFRRTNCGSGTRLGYEWERTTLDQLEESLGASLTDTETSHLEGPTDPTWSPTDR
jgi:hypothetical protein